MKPRLSAISRKAVTKLFSAPSVSQSNYQKIFLGLFSLTVIFSVTDYLSTSFALKIGLLESNFLVVGIGNYLGIGTILALGLTKIFFITGTGAVAVLGVRSRDATFRQRALILLSVLAFVLCAVSLNNIYWIATSL